MSEDFEIIGFDTPEVNGIHFEKANEMSLLELEEYNNQVYKPNDERLNPFKLEFNVILDNKASDRYSLAINLTSTSVGRVSEILNKNYVNIAYWDTYPHIFKNIPVSHLTLHPRSPLSHKLNVFFTNLIRKVLFIK